MDGTVTESDRDREDRDVYSKSWEQRAGGGVEVPHNTTVASS